MKLKELREKTKLTQTEVARISGINLRNYNKYENSVTEPDIETLCKLADFYRTTIDEIVGRKTDIINLNALEPEISTLIKKIIKMNETQKAQTINFVGALTMFDN